METAEAKIITLKSKKQKNEMQVVEMGSKDYMCEIVVK